MNTLYGVTIVDTARLINGRESTTEIFSSSESQMLFAYSRYCSIFDDCGFDENGGEDFNGNRELSKSEFMEEILKEGYVLIQREDSHAQIEIFSNVIPEKKRYRVHAEMTQHLYVDIEAESELEALERAANIDGSEFISLDGPDNGSWEITEATELPFAEEEK